MVVSFKTLSLLAIGTFIAGYIGILILLNWIPNFSIKSFGWLKAKHLRIETKSVTVYIRRAKLNINPFTEKRLSFRIVNVQLYDVEVTIHDTDESKTTPKNPEKTAGSVSPQESLMISLPINEGCVKILAKLLGYLNLHILEFSIYRGNEGKEEAKELVSSVRYTRIENQLKFGRPSNIVVNMFNGFAFKKSTSENKNVFRMIEFSVSFDGSVVRKSGPKSKYSLTNFKIQFSIAKLCFSFNDYAKKNSANKSTVKSKGLNSFSNELQKFASYLNALNSVELKFENPQIEFGCQSYSVSNLVFSITNERKKNGSSLALSFQLGSLEILHSDRRMIGLESATATLLFRFSDINDVFKFLSESEVKSTKLDTSFLIVLNHSVIEIYYDQLRSAFASNAKINTEQKSSNLVNPQHLLQFIKNISLKIVAIGTKVNLHVPTLDDSHLNVTEESTSNHIASLLISAMHMKISTRKIHQLSKNALHNGNHRHLNIVFKIKALELTAEENSAIVSNVRMLATYDLLENNCILVLKNKKISLKQTNSKILSIWTKLSELKSSPNADLYRWNDNDAHKTLSETKNNHSFMEEMIPKFLHNVKVKVGIIQAHTLSNDFLPSFKMNLPDNCEFKDMNNLRYGLSMNLDEFIFRFDRTTKLFDSSFDRINIYDISDSVSMSKSVKRPDRNDSSESEMSDISTINSLLSRGDQSDVMEYDNMDEILNIEKVTVNIAEANNKKLSIRFKEITGELKLSVIWTILYFTTMVKYFKTKQGRTNPKKVDNMVSANPKLTFDVSIDSLGIVVKLPNEVDVLLEIDRLKTENIISNVSIYSKFLRMYVVQPNCKLWTRLLTISDLALQKKQPEGEKQLNLEVCSRSIRVIIPQQYLLYTVIDNIITFAKAIRQIKFNFNDLFFGKELFETIHPNVMSPPNIPTIKLKSKKLGISIEGDPFENELGHIFQLGLIEQRTRLRKIKFFEDKLKDPYSFSTSIDEQIKLSESHPAKESFIGTSRRRTRDHTSLSHNIGSRYFQRQRSNKSATGESPLQKALTNEADSSHLNDIESVGSNDENRKLRNEKIEEAREMLYKDISNSWINKYKIFKATKSKDWRHRMKKLWGEDNISDAIINRFNILSEAQGPDLLNAIFSDIDVTFSPATIENIDEFLRKHGKGQPKLSYSILFPFHLQLLSKSLYVRLKDFPLPLVAFPEGIIKEQKTIELAGNFVINERLITRKEELRFIHVPYISVIDGQDEDSFYCCNIPRTLTPVKCMFDLNCDINTDKACILTWCRSYQSTLSCVGTALDNFTKPPIDDSPLGAWDKLALIAHGKLLFNFGNELSLHMKGSSDPYDLLGVASGLVFLWKDDVKLQIGGHNEKEALVSLDSNEFVLGIPDYVQYEGNAWSIFSTLAADENIRRRSKFSKKVIELASSNRIRWNMNLSFQRNKDTSYTLSKTKERTEQFEPHYNVMVTNPIFDYHPDSYEGYRSDYVHLSLSVTSTAESGTCYNAAHFTPMTFYYIFHWWNLMTDYISLPVRQGRLFNSQVDTTHLKFGTHLFSVGYKLEFQPLTISHMYMDATSIDENTHKTTFTGLKGNFGRCLIDLHQTKELVTYVNEKLDIKNEILHLKMTTGEIDVEEADIRIINARFDENSLSRYLMSCLAKGDHNSFEKCPYGTYNSDRASSSDESEISNKVFSWIDSNDYVELETFERLQSEPIVEVLPFFHTPKFSYFRKFSWDIEGTVTSIDEVHNCMLDREDPSEIQRRLLRRRTEHLNTSLNKKEQEYNDLVDNKASAAEIGKVRNEIEEFKERLELVKSIENGFRGDARISETSSIDELELEKSDTNQYSLYSSQKSYFDIENITNLDSGDSKFHNKFIFHNVQMKWDNKLRKRLVQYIQNISDRRSMVYFMSKQGADLVDNVVKASISEEEAAEFPTLSDPPASNFKKFSGGINEFEEILNELQCDDSEIDNKFLIKFIHPQIQLSSDLVPDSSVIVAARDIELRLINVNLKGMDHIISQSAEVSGLIESRVGALFNDYHTFVFEKESDAVEDSDNPYGADYCLTPFNWPPWVEIEVFYDAAWLRNKLVIERTSSMLVTKKPNVLSSESSNDPKINEFALNVSKMVINVDSKQYTTLYYVLIDLLMKLKTEKSNVMNILDKAITVFDSNDFMAFEDRVKELQGSIREYRRIILQLFKSDFLLNSREKVIIARARVELERLKIELTILMRGVGLKNSKLGHKNQSRIFEIISDQVIWHALDDAREPFVDFALANTSFIWSQSLEGSSFNTFKIEMLQGFNLQTNAIYPEMLQPSKDSNLSDYHSINSDEPVISVTWRMLNPVGGIRIMQDAKLRIRPLKIEIDYNTTKQLFEFFFPQDEADNRQSSGMSDDTSEVSDTSESQISHNSGESKGTYNSFKALVGKKLMAKHHSHAEEDLDSETDSNLSIYSNSLSKHSSPGDMSLKSDKRETHRKPKYRKNGSEPELDDFTLILNRANKYISIMNVEIADMFLLISFKAPKHLHILNVSSLGLNIPKLHYENQIWCGQDFIMRLKRDLIRIILVNSAKILSSKFKHQKQKVQNEPLKQIADYASYMTIQDLQSEGRSRDFSNSMGLHHLYHRRRHHKNKSSRHQASGDEIDQIIDELNKDSKEYDT